MMRTIRNLTIVLLFVTAGLTGEKLGVGGISSAVVHADTSYCWADHVYTIPDGPNAGDRYFVGECDSCDTDAWLMAIESCESYEIMLDYYCNSESNPSLILWWCHQLWVD